MKWCKSDSSDNDSNKEEIVGDYLSVDSINRLPTGIESSDSIDDKESLRLRQLLRESLHELLSGFRVKMQSKVSPKEGQNEEECILRAAPERLMRDDQDQGLENSARLMLSGCTADPLMELLLENHILQPENKKETETNDAGCARQIQEVKDIMRLQSLKHKKERSQYISRIKELENRIASLTQQNEVLRTNKKSHQNQHILQSSTNEKKDAMLQLDMIASSMPATALNPDQIQRYSRQLLLSDGFGVDGQLRLLNSRVLVVGAGGIGSTVLLYLAASGIGHISVVDFDQIEMSNLHRQIIHKDEDEGVSKALSACAAMKKLNPSVSCTPFNVALTFENAHELISKHDCIVDASDNQRTRYLINDACVLAGKPLVSGSAMGTEGQLTVYNHLNGPCYRCLYPQPNSSEGCKSCSDNGVLGPVPGLIGVLQSLEVVKVLTGSGIKKPPRSKKCSVCGENPKIKNLTDSSTASNSARGPAGTFHDNHGQAPLHVVPPLPDNLNITCRQYKAIRNEPHVLIDVRVERQFEMCHLENAINIPFHRLEEVLDEVEHLSDERKPIFCICRRGILSLKATQMLNEAKTTRPKIHSVRNIVGGVTAWAMEVDQTFPQY